MTSPWGEVWSHHSPKVWFWIWHVQWSAPETLEKWGKESGRMLQWHWKDWKWNMLTSWSSSKQRSCCYGDVIICHLLTLLTCDSNLNHPNIVRLYGIYDVDEQTYMVRNLIFLWIFTHFSTGSGVCRKRITWQVEIFRLSIFGAYFSLSHISIDFCRNTKEDANSQNWI